MQRDLGSISEHLRRFGLRNFVDHHGSFLYESTVNTVELAVALNVGRSEVQKIGHTPDDFSRNILLYNYIEVTHAEKCEDFISALCKTGNVHIVGYIAKEFKISLDDSLLVEPSRGNIDSVPEDQSKSASTIRFQVREPVTSFYGREEFLKKIHESIDNVDESPNKKRRKTTVISQLKSVSGLGGVGKTELVRMYLHTYKEYFQDWNVVWVAAESLQTMTSSFTDLAKHPAIQVCLKTIDGGPQSLTNVASAVYQKLCTKKSLIIFDNAQYFGGLDGTQQGQNDGVEQFLPNSMSALLHLPHILVTSRNQDDWSSFEGQGPLILPVFTEDESINFILEALASEDRENAQKLAQLLGGLPLALQQAVAFIKQQKKRSRFKSSSTSKSDSPILDYVKMFQKEKKKVLDFPLPAIVSNYEKTVYLAWAVTIENILKNEEEKAAKYAVDMIQILALLKSDCVPVDLILALAPKSRTQEGTDLVLSSDEDFSDSEDANRGTTVEDEASDGLDLLCKYSMINSHSPGETGYAFNFVSIHRMVQHVIVEWLKETKSRKSQRSDDGPLPIKMCIDLCQICESAADILMGKHLADEPLDNITSNMIELLNRVETFSEGDRKLKEMLFFLRGNVGSTLQARGLGHKALPFFKKNAMDYQSNKRFKHTTNVQLAECLLDLSKFEEALEILLRVDIFDLDIVSLGPELLMKALTMRVDLFVRLGKFSEALQFIDEHKLLEGPPDDVLKERTWMSVISPLYGHLGEILEELQCFPEALEMYQYAVDLLPTLTDDEKYESLWILPQAHCLYEMGPNYHSKLLTLLNKVVDFRTKKFGPSHETTVAMQLDLKFYTILINKPRDELTQRFKIQKWAWETSMKRYGPEHPAALEARRMVSELASDLFLDDESCLEGLQEMLPVSHQYEDGGTADRGFLEIQQEIEEFLAARAEILTIEENIRLGLAMLDSMDQKVVHRFVKPLWKLHNLLSLIITKFQLEESMTSSSSKTLTISLVLPTSESPIINLFRVFQTEKIKVLDFPRPKIARSQTVRNTIVMAIRKTSRHETKHHVDVVEILAVLNKDHYPVDLILAVSPKSRGVGDQPDDQETEELWNNSTLNGHSMDEESAQSFTFVSLHRMVEHFVTEMTKLRIDLEKIEEGIPDSSVTKIGAAMDHVFQTTNDFLVSIKDGETAKYLSVQGGCYRAKTLYYTEYMLKNYVEKFGLPNVVSASQMSVVADEDDDFTKDNWQQVFQASKTTWENLMEGHGPEHPETRKKRDLISALVKLSNRDEQMCLKGVQEMAAVYQRCGRTSDHGYLETEREIKNLLATQPQSQN